MIKITFGGVFNRFRDGTVIIMEKNFGSEQDEYQGKNYEDNPAGYVHLATSYGVEIQSCDITAKIITLCFICQIGYLVHKFRCCGVANNTFFY